MTIEGVSSSRDCIWSSSLERNSTSGPNSATLNFGTLHSLRQQLVHHQNPQAHCQGASLQAGLPPASVGGSSTLTLSDYCGVNSTMTNLFSL